MSWYGEGRNYDRTDKKIAEGMQYKLDKNASKKGGWNNYNKQGNRIWDKSMAAFLKKKLREEVAELFELIDGRKKLPPDKECHEEIFYEACDVANIAMMLADICEAIPTGNLLDGRAHDDLAWVKK